MANGEPVNAGTERLQPPGCSAAEPRCQIASMTTETSVPATSPMKMPPSTCRTARMPVSSSVNTKTIVGTVLIEPVPPVPSPTAGDGTPVDPMNPASTSPMNRMNAPMNRMNAPMPAVIASFSCIGTASKISVRKPVAARITMMMPLMTTRPIASGQVSEPTTVVARNELMPSPAANANGSLATSPNMPART